MSQKGSILSSLRQKQHKKHKELAFPNMEGPGALSKTKSKSKKKRKSLVENILGKRVEQSTLASFETSFGSQVLKKKKVQLVDTFRKTPPPKIKAKMLEIPENNTFSMQKHFNLPVSKLEPFLTKKIDQADKDSFNSKIELNPKILNSYIQLQKAPDLGIKNQKNKFQRKKILRRKKCRFSQI